MVYPPTEFDDSRSRLIKEHLYLVDILAGRMVTQVPSFMNRDDIQSAGMLGLFDAANKFDVSKNIKFKTFAEHRIRGSILDEMRKLDWFSRSLRDKNNRISRTMSDLEFKLSRSPSEIEMAQAMGISLEDYRRMLTQVSHLGCVSLNETLDQSNQGRSFLDTLVDTHKDSSPSSRLEKSELTKILAEIIDTLSDKEKFVISLYYYEELTQKEIAEVLDLSEGRVSQLHSQALIKLKTKAGNQLF